MPYAVKTRDTRGGYVVGAPGFRRIAVSALMIIFALAVLKASAAAPSHELVSFRCALAIKAVFAELEKLSENPVTKETVGNIDDSNGEFVCIPINPREIQVRLQSTELTAADHHLVFALDAATYVVLKTYFGR